MENAMDAVKVAEMKEETLRQVLEQVHAQASSIFSFALQWKDLDDYLKLSKCNLSKQAQDLALQEKKIMETAKVLEQRDKAVEIKLKGIESCSADLEMKEKQLALIKKWIEECTLEFNLKEKKLKVARKEVENCHEKLNVEREQLSMTQVELEECNSKLKEERQQLGKVQKSIEESAGELELKNSELFAVKRALAECNKELFLKQEQKCQVQNSLDKCCEELEFKKKEAEKMSELVGNRNHETELKKKELHDLKNSITDCNSLLELKDKKLNLLQNLIENCCRDLDVKGKELEETQTLIEECRKELNLEKKEKGGTAKLIEEQLQVLNLKEKELSGIQKVINEKSEDLRLKEKLLDSINELIKENTEELEIKEKQHEAIKASIVVRSADLKMKEADLDLIEKSIKEGRMELHSVDKQLNSFWRSKDQLAKELQTKEEELKSVRKKLRSYYEHLKSKETDLHACEIAMKELMQNLNTKEKLLTSVQTSIEECSKELYKMKEQHNLVKKSIVSEEKNLDLARKSLKECCYQLESRKEQLESIQRTSCKLFKGLEEKERHFDLLEMAFQERLKEFQVKETQFEERVKDFKLKEKQFDSMKRTIEELGKEVELKQKLLNDSLHLRVVIKRHENSSADTNSMSASLQCCIPSDGANLQLLLNQHLMVHDLVLNEVRTAIQSSLEPAKMVLDAMPGFYPLGSNSGNLEFGINIIRRSCITLLKLLLNISPMIESQVRGEAMKLAVEWRAKMRAMPKNSLEVLGFLQLLAAFKLASAFSATELQSLLDTIKPRGQDPELQKGLGIADNLAGSMSPACSSSANLQSNANSAEGFLQPVQFDCVGEPASAHLEIFAALKFSSDPAKLVLNVMGGFQKNENTSFDARSLSSKVFLLEQLMKISPDISPCLKEEALGLALLWEAKMRSETKNSMEVLGFMLFLAIYGLAPHFKRDQIFELIEIVLEHKQAAEICRALGLVDVPAGFMQILPVSGCTQLHGRIHPSSSPMQGNQKRPRLGR